jgi:glycosyltransferase involved in cell wall biosynthesis
MRVLYLYAGARKEFYEKWKRGLMPDTQLLGLNYMKKLGIDAGFVEWRLPEFLRKISFNLVHLPYIFAIKKYDIVFICAGLPLVFLAKYILRWKKPRFVIYNTFLANALARNPRGITGFITRKTIENLDIIICTARSQIQPLINAGIAPEKIKFVPIGIDAQKFYMSGSSDSRVSYILSVGRDLGRDYKTLFEAVHGLDVKVIVATKREAIEGLTPPPNVEVRFNVPYEEMPALYTGAMFVVTPLKRADSASGSETSGQYGYLEPMAAGKAVITTDKPTVRDYIENEKTGILVPPENPAALRAAIQRLIGSTVEPIRKTLGMQAQKAVLENFTSEKWARSLAEIFKKMG